LANKNFYRPVRILYTRSTIKKTGAHGGSESESGVMQQVYAVQNALKKLKIPCRATGVITLRETRDILAEAKEKIIFNLIETLNHSAAEAALVPALCGASGKGWTGNSTAGFLLSTDKWQSKAVLRIAGFPVPEAIIIGKNEKAVPAFHGPYIVKPAASDGSEGIDDQSIIMKHGGKLRQAVQRIHKYFNQDALVEQYINGRELNVSILHIQSAGRTITPRVLPIAEIDFRALKKKKLPAIVGYEAKWIEDSFAYRNTPRILPAPLPRSVKEKIIRYSSGACAALGCRDYCRVDFRLDRRLNPYIIEVNANPDISPTAGLSAALTAAAIPFTTFIKICLRNASRRIKS